METNSKRIKQEEEEAEEGSSKHPWLSVSPGQETFRDCPVKKEGHQSGISGPTTPRNKTSLASVETGNNGMFQGCGVGGYLKEEPDHFARTSPTQGDDIPAVCFTIQPTEEDYGYQPRKRKHREYFTPVKYTGQEATQDRGQHQSSFPPFFPQEKTTLCSVQPTCPVPIISSAPAVSYKVYYNPYYLLPVPYVSSLSYHIDLARSSMEEGRAHHCIHPQTGQIVPAFLSRETAQQPNSTEKILSGSFTLESYTQPSILTNQQLSSNRNEANKSEGEIDVVGLF
ncbi:uncharacterized protein LOC102288551 isoform X3 [Haplochromis burtoni]|uniref:Transcription factor Sox-14-like n=1 Tax=Haplochromis burtoni TaxID=8153 RepID=A0A3Q2V7P7_HAPBU|nr:uncharacterized protein LOC102288551 isoform X3 [Haplochromis burtoni]